VSEFCPAKTSTAEASTLQQLHDAMELIFADAARAELWASALSAFAQPVPEYDRVLVPVEKWAQTQQP
jgi:hypothetical protein